MDVSLSGSAENIPEASLQPLDLSINSSASTFNGANMFFNTGLRSEPSNTPLDLSVTTGNSLVNTLVSSKRIGECVPADEPSDKLSHNVILSKEPKMNSCK